MRYDDKFINTLTRTQSGPLTKRVIPQIRFFSNCSSTRGLAKEIAP